MRRRRIELGSQWLEREGGDNTAAVMGEGDVGSYSWAGIRTGAATGTVDSGGTRFAVTWGKVPGNLSEGLLGCEWR
jgi:hypothetical protein